MLTGLCACASAASSQTAPVDAAGSRYLVPRALVEDYIVCAVESSGLAGENELSAALSASLAETVGTQASEAASLRLAVASCEQAGRIEAGRLTSSRASLAAAVQRAALAESRAVSAERSRRRWRAFALAGPAVLVGVGFVAGAVLTR